MPPSWTVRCALERRRSAPARCRAAPVSGNSQKAWIEMRGTGRSCGAAPKSCLSVSCVFMPLPLVLRRRDAGLFVGQILLALVGGGDLALLVIAHHGDAAGGIVRAHVARAQQVAGIGD